MGSFSDRGVKIRPDFNPSAKIVRLSRRMEEKIARVNSVANSFSPEITTRHKKSLLHATHPIIAQRLLI